jgi:hypothetical protein
LTFKDSRVCQELAISIKSSISYATSGLLSVTNLGHLTVAVVDGLRADLLAGLTLVGVRVPETVRRAGNQLERLGADGAIGKSWIGGNRSPSSIGCDANHSQRSGVGAVSDGVIRTAGRTLDATDE